ncbi:UNVERIFIED_CONTAM: hypothetical protein FKN15_072985 [Acipenser sinensis]
MFLPYSNYKDCENPRPNKLKQQPNESRSCHDSYILRQGPLEAFGREGNLGTGHLIGDSGYPLLPWLLTPVKNPQTSAGGRYTEALC